MRHPLDGIKVLDFTHEVAGPYCSMLLGDLGCDVIKIERPNRGDPTRYMNVSDKFVGDIPDVGGDYFLAINRNKRSLGVDIKTKEGIDICLALARWADIVVQNFRPGVLERAGLGYAELSRINPRLVYANLSAYGASGMMANRPGMDVAVQARSGVMHITGAFGSNEPIKPGVSLSDFGGGIYLTTAVLAALYDRERTGRGQEVEVTLLDATMSMLINYSVAVMDGGVDLGPMGSGHPQLVPYQAFPTADGFVVISAGTNKIYRALCAVLDCPELGSDAQFLDNPARVANRDDLVALLSARTTTRTTAAWLRDFETAGVPCAPVNTLAEGFAELAGIAPDMVQEVAHPTAGTLHVLGVPFRFSETGGEVRTPPPRLAEHTDVVLTEILGMSAPDVSFLRSKGVI